MRRVACLLLVLLAMFAGIASAQEEGLRLAPAPVNRLDDESLQRGARNFVNYCLTCHSAQYMRYNRLTDLGLTEAQITDNLMFATDKIGETMTVALTPANGKAWFGNPPPDLTVEARIRGRNWLYNYLLGFYRDEKSATGWNNLVFPNVGMPNVLWQLSGQKMLRVSPDVPGTMTRTEYETFVTDLVNYMDYMAEPIRNKRIHLGIVVLLFLGVLFTFAYALKREYWKDLH